MMHILFKPDGLKHHVQTVVKEICLCPQLIYHDDSLL